MNEKDREKLKEIEGWHIRLPEGEAEEQVERLHEHRGWLLVALEEEQRGSLSQARALLQRARPWIAPDVPDVVNAAVEAQPTATIGALRGEIEAFLAGLPVTCGERHPKGEATCEREPHGDEFHAGGGRSWKTETVESLGMTEGPPPTPVFRPTGEEAGRLGGVLQEVEGMELRAAVIHLADQLERALTREQS